MTPELSVIDGGRASPPSSEAPDVFRLTVDLEAEASTISTIVNDESTLDEVRTFLRAEHFYSEAHRRMFEAVCQLRDAGQPIDVVTLGTKLRENDRLAQCGGMAYLTTVLNAAPAFSAARLVVYARTVRDRWIRREARSLASALNASTSTDGRPIDEILAAARDRVDTLTLELGASEKDALMLNLLRRTTARLSAMVSTDGKGELPCGFDRFDRITGGLQQTLMILAARPGMGKTSLAMNMGVNVAMKPDGQQGVYMASLETFDEEAMMRLWCSEARVAVTKARTGMLSRDDWARLTVAAARINDLPMWIDDTPAQTVASVWAKCRRVNGLLRRRGGRLRLVIVDYLQLLKGSRGGMSREEVVSESARGLLAMSNDLKCCVLALAQLNRDCEKRNDKRPILADLRESGEIEQAARVVSFIYRDDYYNKDSAERNIAEIIVAKQNNGPTDFCKLRFDGNCTRFDNLAEDEYLDYGD